MKINLNKICFTLSLALLLATFFLGENAKASTVQQWELNNGTTPGGSLTITTQENGAIVCFFNSNGVGFSPFPYLDNEENNFTKIDDDGHMAPTGMGYDSYVQSWGVYIKTNVTAGAHTIIINPIYYGSMYRMRFNCFLDNEITTFATSTPEITVNKDNSPTAFLANYFLENTNGKMVYSWIRSQNGNWTGTTPHLSTLPYYGNQYINYTGMRQDEQFWQETKTYSYKSDTNSLSQELTYPNPGSAYWDYAVLKNYVFNTQAPLPPCQSYNYSSWGTCGENSRQYRTILSSNPTACNYTDTQSAAPVLGQDCVYTAPVYPDVSLPFTIISPFTFSFNSTAKVDYTYDKNAFTPYDYIEIRRLSSNWATSTFISTSSPVANDFLSDGHSFFPLTGDPEIRGRYNYEVTGYFAPYYLPGVGDVPATSSIPVVFSVYWQETEVPTAQDIIDYEHTLSTEFSHGVLYETSCTNEEWATPDPQVNFGFGVWTFPALNMTKLHCLTELAALELGSSVIDKMTGYFSKISNMLKNVFPFNIYTNLNESWKDSKNTEVLPELSFLSPVDGNLSVQVPNGTVGSSTSFILWGSGIFTSPTTLGADNASKASQLFGAIRTIIKWALWGLFGFWVVRNGQAFVKKMTGGE